MAIVQNYYSPQGCNIIVHDDCYKDISSEENEARLKRASEIVLRAEFEKFIKSQKEK